ncbi:unnamed protein product, partial [Didymodactylos carnosus]
SLIDVEVNNFRPREFREGHLNALDVVAEFRRQLQYRSDDDFRRS